MFFKNYYLMFKNLLANIIGKTWNLISTIVFIPFYLKFLDFESFSIISFSVLLFSIITICDAGMTASLSRELARTDTDSDTKKITFDTLKTTYLFISFFVILIAFIFSKSIAINFVKTEFFSLEILTLYIRIISIGIGFQMFLNFSIAGIIALNKQVLANKLLIFWSIFRNGIVVLILYFYPRLDLFFAWQTLSTVIFSIIALYYLTVFVKFKFEFNLSFDINNFPIQSEKNLTVVLEVTDLLIELVKGWNLIGSGTSENMIIDDPNNIVIPNSVYSYDSTLGYQNTTNLKISKGYWIKTNNAGPIILKPL